MRTGTLALLWRLSPSSFLGKLLRLQMIGNLIDHFARDEFVLERGIAEHKASALCFALCLSHLNRACAIDQILQFFSHGSSIALSTARVAHVGLPRCII